MGKCYHGKGGAENIKIALITKHNIKNYGSVLQLYAMVRYLESMGHGVEVIDYVAAGVDDDRSFYLTMGEKWRRHFYTRIPYLCLFIPSRIKQKNIFSDFVARYVNLTKVHYSSLAHLKTDPPPADMYLTGSDQVWNSDYNQGLDRAYFLDFGADATPRVAYAASFGKSRLDEFEVQATRQLVNKYSYISVREKSGLEILSRLGREDAVHVVDPTLLFTRPEWAALMNPDRIKHQYLLVYMLDPDTRLIDIAQQIARRQNLKIVKVGMDLFKPGYVDILMSHQGPADFLTLFANAAFVVTNSFHGTAFAVNFNRQFISVATRKYSTRMASFLDLMELNHRLVTDEYREEEQLGCIDYQPVNARLDKEREKSKLFIAEALENIDRRLKNASHF